MLQAAEYDLSTAFLDQPDVYAYSTVRGAGNRVLQHELADKSRVVFHILGKGRWDSALRLWVNNAPFSLAAANFHFHPGDDGEIGFGMAASSTGGDNHVDSFFSSLPGGLDAITFSRYAWMALKVPADPKAPSADLTVLGDFKARRVRIFDNTGTQTSFAWSDNWAWIICDYLIEKFVLREGKVNQPLITAELARFDWQAFSDAAAYYDAVLSGGQKRFSDGGVVYLRDGETATQVLEQMLLVCRSYLREPNGKFTLYPDQPRASVFTFTSDNVKPGSFKAYKSNLRSAYNRFVGAYRDSGMASGSSDDATRYAISSVTVDHKAHQRAIGARGLGLSVIPKAKPLQLDLGNNTPERSYRILKSMAIRQLGDDVDENTAYRAPQAIELTGFEDSEKVEPGDRATIDTSLSEEFGARDFEVQEIDYAPDGERTFRGLEYMVNAFPDTAPTQQALQAPAPGNGLTTAMTVDGNGALQLVDADHIAADGSIYQRGGILVGSTVAVENGNFEADGTILPPPGWAVYNDPNVVLAYETASPFSGIRSLKITSAAITGGVISVRRYACRPGDVFRITCQAKRVSGAGNASLAFSFRDGSGAELAFAAASTTSAGFVLISASAIAPAGTVYATIECASTGATTVTQFDEIHIARMQTAFEVTPINTSGTFTGANPLSQSGVSTTILVAGSTMQFGDGPVSYNSGSVNPGSLGTWYVYGDDPGFAGGAITYVATATPQTIYAANGRIYFGKITTVGGGGAGGSDGGSGGGRKAL